MSYFKINQRSITYRELGIITLFYSLAHLGIFLSSSALFWDDWQIYNKDFITLKDEYTSLGIPWYAYFFHGLHQLNLPSARIWTFISHLLTGLALCKILFLGTRLNRDQILITTVLYLVAPFFLSRISIVLISYTTCNLMFFLGWLALLLSLEKKLTGFRILSICCFIVSFSTPSLLLFYLLPALHLFLLDRQTEQHSIFRFIPKYLDFVLLPILYFIIKLSFFSPYGKYEDYNAISLSILSQNLGGPYLVVFDFFKFAMEINPFVLISLFVIFWLYMPRLFFQTQGQQKNKILLFCIIGIGMFVYLVGSLPYMFVGKTPLFWDWHSRHQLLLPFGAALTLVGFLELLQSKIKRFFLAGILALSITFSLQSYWEYFIDSIKQQSYMLNIKNNQAIRNGTTFPIINQAKDYDARRRVIRYYEYTGLFRMAFDGEQTRFGLNYSDKKTWVNDERYNSPSKWKDKTNLRDYKFSTPDCIIMINKGDYLLSFINIIKLMLKRTNADLTEYKDTMRRVLEVSCINDSNIPIKQ